jgi:hypothetical protein
MGLGSRVEVSFALPPTPTQGHTPAPANKIAPFTVQCVPSSSRLAVPSCAPVDWLVIKKMIEPESDPFWLFPSSWIHFVFAVSASSLHFCQ